MALETQLIDVLSTGPRLTVTGDALTMTASDGRLVEMIRVELDPDHLLVTSAPVEMPAEPTGLVGSSVPPTPLPPTTGPEQPTPEVSSLPTG